VDFSGAQLLDADLDGANLTGARISEAQLAVVKNRYSIVMLETADGDDAVTHVYGEYHEPFSGHAAGSRDESASGVDADAHTAAAGSAAAQTEIESDAEPLAPYQPAAQAEELANEPAAEDTEPEPEIS
jgi:hypothetical protein